MTASIFDRRQRLIAEGRRLHMAIVDWGQKHGLRAYRVLTDDDCWFEIYNPATKTLSRAFPEKIQTAIAANKEALQAYAEDERSWDARRRRFDAQNIPVHPARYRFCQSADREKPDRKSTRLNSSHIATSRMPSSA